MKTTIHALIAVFVVASVVLIGGAGGSATAADKWFVLGENTIMSTGTSTEIKGEAGKMFKEDIKATKLSVGGADVEISQVVLHWANSANETIKNLGVIKAGEQSNLKDAPGREATLLSVAITYKILNNAPQATVTLWGLD